MHRLTGRIPRPCKPRTTLPAAWLTLCPLAPAICVAQPYEITAVPTNAGPLDLPGHAPTPKAPSSTPLPVLTGARPSEPIVPREWFSPEGAPWITWTRLTGDWNGDRTILEERGISVAGSFRTDWSTVISGGSDQTAFSRRVIDINVTVELDRLTEGGWQGATFYADFYHYGGQTTEPSGSLQSTDVLASGRSLDQLAELWVEQTFADGSLRVKLGKIDANVDFAAIPCATGFRSANGSWDPTLLDMPTYPDPAFGAVMAWAPCENFNLSMGIFDGATHDGRPTGPRGPSTFFSDSASDSWYFVSEGAVLWTCADRAGQATLGVWHHTGDYARFDSTTQSGTTGFYGTIQQQLTRRGDEALADAGIFAFARIAFADEDVAQIKARAAAGLVSKGTFHGRDSDETGLMWSWADLARQSGADGDEHTFEAYYTIALTPALSVSPHLQYTLNPGGDASLGDALVVGAVILVTF